MEEKNNISKSHISGTGYGSSHIWKRLETRKLPYYASNSLKNTIYKCKVCGTPFIHYYDTIADIFEALKKSGVPDKCEENLYIVKDFIY